PISTASPYKFPCVVTKAITNKEEIQDFAAISILNDLSGVSLPKAVTDLQKAEVIHRTVVPTSNMRETVEECLGLKQ
ncbi:threonine synthase, partial [Streptococcus suis]|nr:threonine synthase [Streptococcus suis]